MQNSDKMLCIHAIYSSTCEKCLWQKKNYFFAIENNNQKINDEDDDNDEDEYSIVACTRQCLFEC
jgi:hypothetical protein